MEELLGTIQSTENLLLIGGLGFFVYWFLSSDSTQSIRDAFASLMPKGVSEKTLPPGTQTAGSGGAGSLIGTTADGFHYSVSAGGTVNVDTGGTPVNIGHSSQVPGTGQTVSDLLAAGYTYSDIASLIGQYEKNPSAYSVSGNPIVQTGAGVN